jgi:hypothetical protein
VEIPEESSLSSLEDSDDDICLTPPEEEVNGHGGEGYFRQKTTPRAALRDEDTYLSRVVTTETVSGSFGRVQRP